MSKIICICGLPGSGKTFLSKRFVELGCELVDDPPASFNIRGLDKSKNYVICDPYLCSIGIRERALRILNEMGFDVEFLYFENNVEKCKANLKRRELAGDTRKINSFTCFNYEIPEGAETIEIWQNHDS